MNDHTLRVMTATGIGERETPQDLFDQLNAEFHFGLDAAADEANHKCDRWLGPGGLVPDALAPDVNWHVLAEGKPIWLNPPYGRGVEAWLGTAHAMALFFGATVVVLLPARTDTEWFHELVIPYAAEIRFLRGRLRFSGMEAGAPFPSMVVVYRPQHEGKYRWARWAR